MQPKYLINFASLKATANKFMTFGKPWSLIYLHRNPKKKYSDKTVYSLNAPMLL